MINITPGLGPRVSIIAAVHCSDLQMFSLGESFLVVRILLCIILKLKWWVVVGVQGKGRNSFSSAATAHPPIDTAIKLILLALSTHLCHCERIESYGCVPAPLTKNLHMKTGLTQNQTEVWKFPKIFFFYFVWFP